MDILIIIGITLAVVVLLWLNILATIALKHDDTLNKFQKTSQTIFVWVLPYFGAVIILHLIFQHSPNTIPKAWIPWPFKIMVYGKDRKPNSLRDEGGTDYWVEGTSNHGSAGDIGGDTGGGD